MSFKFLQYRTEKNKKELVQLVQFFVTKLGFTIEWSKHLQIIFWKENLKVYWNDKFKEWRLKDLDNKGSYALLDTISISFPMTKTSMEGMEGVIKRILREKEEIDLRDNSEQ